MSDVYRGWTITYSAKRPATGTYVASSKGVDLNGSSRVAIERSIDQRIEQYPPDGHGNGKVKKPCNNIIVRVGDSDDYHCFGQDFDALCDHLIESGVRSNLVADNKLQVRCEEFQNNNNISLYYSDAEVTGGIDENTEAVPADDLSLINMKLAKRFG